MANKRQREARKKFIAAGGVPVVPAPKKRPRESEERQEAPKKKKKKTQKGKGKDTGAVALSGKASNVANGEEAAAAAAARSKGKKWRLENFGEGKGCHLCKGKDHVKRDCPTYDAKKVCLLCRERGHSIKRCPQNTGGGDEEAAAGGGRREAPKAAGPACYNCGLTGHRLADCKQPLKDGGAAFAVCFICNEKGHLSKACPSNSHGVYPKGGSCKVCGEVTHLAKDCPQRVQKRTKLQIPGSGVASTAAAFGSKRVVFQSGDDLEDDFVEGGAEDMAEEEEKGMESRKSEEGEGEGSAEWKLETRSILGKGDADGSLKKKKKVRNVKTGG